MHFFLCRKSLNIPYVLTTLLSSLPYLVLQNAEFFQASEELMNRIVQSQVRYLNLLAKKLIGMLN